MKRSLSLSLAIVFVLSSVQVFASALPPASLAISPASHDFGDAPAWAMMEQIFTVTNNGSDTLNVTSVGISGDDREMFPLFWGASPFELAPGESHQISVRFNPTEFGPRSAWIRLETTDAEAPVIEADMTGNCLAGEISLSPPGHLFDDLLVGEHQDQDFVITNEGNAPLEMSLIEIIGAEAGAFEIVAGADPVSIEAGATHTVTVRFAPSEAGEFEGLLHMYSTDPDESIVDAGLVGTAYAPSLQLSHTSKSFGTLAPGDSSVEEVALENVGASAVNIVSLPLTGDQAGLFSVREVAPFTLNPGESISIGLTYKPVTEGAASAQLLIYHNLDGQAPLSVALSGQCEDPSRPDISFSHNEFDYGQVEVESELAQIFQVYNRGDAVLAVNTVQMQGEDAEQFQIVAGGNAFELAPGDSHAVTLWFAPQAAGEFEAHLKFYSNDAESNPAWITVEGDGVGGSSGAPDISLEPGYVQFGVVDVGNSEDRVVTVYNEGDEVLTVSEVKFLHGDTEQFVLPDNSGFELAPGDSQQVTVTYRPTAAGSHNSHLKFYSNDPDENPIWADLYGQGNAEGLAQPEVDLTPSTYNFGEVSVYEEHRQVFWIFNRGDSTLVVREIKIYGGENQHFKIRDGGEACELAPADSHAVVVGFKPLEAGQFSSYLKVYSNDADEDPIYSRLFGEGEHEDEMAPDLAVRPRALEFYDTVAGDTTFLWLTLKNVGDAKLLLGEYQIVGGGKRSFTLMQPFQGTGIDAGDSLMVRMAFHPAHDSEYSATLKIYSNDPDVPRYEVPLSGEGVDEASAWQIVNDHVEFGEVSVGQSPVQEVWVINRNTEPLFMGTPLIEVHDSTDFSLPDHPVSTEIAVGDTAFIQVMFAPTSPGRKKGRLLLMLGMSGAEEVVELEGKGVASDMTPPVLRYCYPAPGSQNVPQNVEVQVGVKDLGISDGLDLASLQVQLNGGVLVQNGEDRTGGLIRMERQRSKIKLFYNPPEDFEPGETVTVDVRCQDLASPAHLVDSSYTFTILKAVSEVTETDTVDQDGGVITCDSTHIQMHIPSGALEDTTEITIARIDSVPALPDTVSGLGLQYHFGPDGLEFNEPVTLQIPYTQDALDAAGVTDPMDLAIYYYHTSTGEWVALEVINADDEFIYVLIEEFCYLNIGKYTGVATAVDEKEAAPVHFELEQNYPNPFNPQTEIGYRLAKGGQVSITVYDGQGRLVRRLVDEVKPSGHFTALWDATDDAGHTVASGIYFYVARFEGGRYMRKMLFVK